MNDSDRIRSLYAAFGRGDVPSILEHLDEQVLWSYPLADVLPWGGVRRGREGVLAFFRQLAEAADVLEFEPREFVAQDGTVVVLGRERVRSKATGASYATEFAHVWKLSGGRVMSYGNLIDTQAAASVRFAR